MAGHDIIVLGASAGGVDACAAVVRALPPDLPAAVFVVQHVAASAPSLLPGILARAGALPAQHPVSGTLISHGQIYVAPPDHHLLVERGHVHVLRGPKENGFRPAIDATLRTAARAYGPRAVGVVLTGMLDDGTAGLLALKRHGGLAVVQDPSEAAFPSMPQSALRYVQVDAVCTLVQIAPLLVQLARTPAHEERIVIDTYAGDLPSAPLADEADDPFNRAHTLTPFSCPDCGGVLMEYYDGELLRFRCQVGHVYSRESVIERQSDTIDYAVWAAYRALNERVELARRLTRDAQALGDTPGARRFTQLAEQAEHQKERLRQIMLQQA